MNPSRTRGINWSGQNGGKELTMKRTSRLSTRLLWGVLLLGISLHLFAFPGDARAVNVNMSFVSDADDPFWAVSDTKGTFLGAPENVCLNDTSPLPCPGDAIKYGHVSPGVWSADLSPISGAKWIWAPNITGQTSPAANAEFTFTHDFVLCNPLQDGTIYIAVDDSAEVYLNGSPTPVLTTTSNLLRSKTIPKNSLIKFEFPTFKKNTITIKAKNAYLDWCDPVKTKGAKDNYQCNPAGMVFGASFLDDEPSCTGSRGETLQPMEFEHYCPPGQTGSTGYCAPCGNFISFNNCIAQPPTCTGYTFSAWYACGTNGQQTRTITGITPAGCTGTPSTQPVLTQACPTCTYTYSNWGPCQANKTQTRSVVSSSPSGCTGTPVLTQACPTCTYTYSNWGPCQANKTQTRSVVSSSPSGCTGTPVLSRTCTPQLGELDKCAETHQGFYNELGVCPAGTECKKRRTCWNDCALWIFFCDSGCTDTTDAYCDPI